MKVISKYSIEDCVFVANYINEQNPVQANPWVKLYYFYIFANGIAFPALLFYFDYSLAGMAVFLINLFFLNIVADKIKNESYKAYYRHLFLESEFRETEVELLESGVSCKSVEGDTFFYWHNFRKVLETSERIYLFTRTTGVIINKNSFELETQLDTFLAFTKARIPLYLSK
jgi:hypothetical protein